VYISWSWNGNSVGVSFDEDDDAACSSQLDFTFQATNNGRRLKTDFEIKAD